MKTHFIALTACLAGAGFAASTRERISINNGWRFHMGDPNGNFEGLIYHARPEVRDEKDDKAGMGRLPSDGVGWYRKKLDVTAADAGKSICLEIDGAMSYAAVWLNGKLVGGWDDVVYEPGELKIMAYRAGKEWAANSVRTAEGPARLEALADRSEIRADGLGLSFVTVRAKNAIRFSIEGPGEIVATDNGDPTSFEPFQQPARKAFNGLCLVIGKPGTILLKAESDLLQAVSISLQGISSK